MQPTRTFGKGGVALFKLSSPLRMPDAASIIGQVQSLFLNQPRTVLSWLQSVTLISGYRHVGSHLSVQVVYIVIEINTSGIYVE